MYRLLIRPILFLLPPEKAHHFTLFILKIFLFIPFVRQMVKQVFLIKNPKLKRSVLGLEFENPVGLAAGFDKDGKHYRAMECLGFGFIEIGTVTPKAQAGNPQPRMFRLSKDEGLINRMGFNNEGVEAMTARLKNRPKSLIIGGNIGKNKNTPNENAVDDYVFCFETLFQYVDYFVVNVSSPNTPGLRDLQDKEPLTKLLSKLQELNHEKPAPKPILLKIAPDLSDSQLEDIVEIVGVTKIDGVIATNTTISRDGLSETKDNLQKIGEGGLSGKPLKQRSTEVIRYLNKKTNGRMTIIGAGGISSAEDAIEKLDAGASLIQVYTGMIYEGPALVRKINKAILNHLQT